MVLFELLNLIYGIAFVLDVIILLFNFFSRKRRVIYAVKILIFSYIVSVGGIGALVYLHDQSFAEVGFVRFFIMPIFIAFLIATIVALIESAQIHERWARIKLLKKRKSRNNTERVVT